MKFFIVQVLLLMACQSAYKSIGNTPNYLATVQERMPGNIPADETPPRHFVRMVYLQLDNTQSLSIDSMVYNSIPLTYSIEKIPANKSLKIGAAFFDNKPITLATNSGKSWWRIGIAEGNDSFDQLPVLEQSIMIYSSVNNNKETWQIEKEITIAPVEHY